MQGPPGTGKTYTGARIAVALMRAGPAGGRDRAQPQGDPQPARRDRAGRPRSGRARSAGYKRGDGDNAYASELGDDSTIENVDNARCEAAGRRRAAARRHVVAVRAARDGGHGRHAADRRGRPGIAGRRAGGRHQRPNLILLGDPQQLAQVAQGGHPEATAVSRSATCSASDAHDAGRSRAVHRRQPAHAPRRLPLRQRDQLRRRADTASTSAHASASTPAACLAPACAGFLVEHAGNRRDVDARRRT